MPLRWTSLCVILRFNYINCKDQHKHVLVFIKSNMLQTTWVKFGPNTCKNTYRQEDMHQRMPYGNTKVSNLQPDNEDYFLFFYIITYSLIPYSTVLLDKLTGSQLVKKFPAFCRTRWFITAFSSARHLSLSSASSIQSIHLHILLTEDPS